VLAAQRSLDLSTTRYKGGVTSYLEVITAQNAALTDEVTAVNILGAPHGSDRPIDPSAGRRVG
jgi:outer membrane protein TolC